MNNNLESGCFESSDQEDQTIILPTPEMINKYNREYSTIVQEIQHFLKQAIDSVQKFVTFHNFGVDFNLPHLLNNLYLASNNFKMHLSSTQRNNKDSKKIAKDKYEVSFNRLIHRMSDLFKDMVQCEIEFKRSYFGTQNTNQAKQKAKMRKSYSGIQRSASSLTKSSKSEKMKLYQLIQNQAKEQQRQAQLRATLKQRLKPKATVAQSQCKPQYSTTENLYRLNEKIEVMFNDMKAMRNRQQKLIELFNLNRIKKIHLAVPTEEAPSSLNLNISTISSIAPVVEEDLDHEEMDEILEDWRGRQSSESIRQDTQSTRGFFKKRLNL